MIRESCETPVGGGGRLGRRERAGHQLRVGVLHLGQQLRIERRGPARVRPARWTSSESPNGSSSARSPDPRRVPRTRAGHRRGPGPSRSSSQNAGGTSSSSRRRAVRSAFVQRARLGSGPVRRLLRVSGVGGFGLAVRRHRRLRLALGRADPRLRRCSPAAPMRRAPHRSPRATPRRCPPRPTSGSTSTRRISARPTSVQVWMPSPWASTRPLGTSSTDTLPRTSERMPSSVQKKAARLGSVSIR